MLCYLEQKTATILKSQIFLILNAMRKHFSHITCHKQTWQIKCMYMQKPTIIRHPQKNRLAAAYSDATRNKNLLDRNLRIHAYIELKNVSYKIRKI